MRTEEKIVSNAGYTEEQIQEFTSSTSIFFNHGTPLYISHVYFTTNYAAIITTTMLFWTVSERVTPMNLTYIELDVSGTIMDSFSPMQLYFAHSTMDLYKTRFGVAMNMNCGIKEEFEKIWFHVENVTGYYSQPRLANLAQRHSLVLRGYGDVTIKDTNLFNYAEDGMVMCSAGYFYGTA